MDAPQFFFSYSRSDSEFVLSLAKELRSAGANLWLDQLDIVGGIHWDQAIEDALKASKGVIVVLSSEAVESMNVMDEVSYALEEGKLVVPVIHRDCNVPFRIRRLQRVDFTHDSERALAELLRALGVKPSAPEPAEPEEEKEEEIIENSEPEPTPEPAPKPEQEPSSTDHPAATAEAKETEPPQLPPTPLSPSPPSNPSLLSSGGARPHRGGMLLTFGISSIVGGFVCFPTFVIGTVGIFMGLRDMKSMKEGNMDPNGVPMTQGAIICGIVGTIVGIGMLSLMIYVMVTDPTFLNPPPSGTVP